MLYPSNIGIHRDVRGRTGPVEAGTVKSRRGNKHVKNNEDVQKAAHDSEEDFEQNPNQHDGPNRSRKETTDQDAD